LEKEVAAAAAAAVPKVEERSYLHVSVYPVG
jgi:hypothetical protein